MNVIISSIDGILNSEKANNLQTLLFGMSCCSIELTQAVFSGFDIPKEDLNLIKQSPEHADLLICTGAVNAKSASELAKLYKQIPNPKYVIALGACAISGSMFCDSYNKIKGIDSILPVDIYLPGCPAKPEALLDAVKKLKNKIQNSTPSENQDGKKTNPARVLNDSKDIKPSQTKNLEVIE